MAGTRVHLLPGGSLVIPEAVALDDGSRVGMRRIPVFSVLVDHDEGLFLFDSGFDLDHVRRHAPHSRPRQRPSETIPAQLHRLGKRPGDITHAVNSHLHYDHCGGNHHCTTATTICHARELEMITAARPERGYSDVSCLGCRLLGPAGADGAEEPPEPPAAGRLEAVTGDVDIARGVRLVETAGHTPGHYSLLVTLSKSPPLLFTGDACYARSNYEQERLQAGNLDPNQAHASLMRLKALALSHDARIVFPHDPESWPHYRKAPAYYS